jgi:hypothetical protein
MPFFHLSKKAKFCSCVNFHFRKKSFAKIVQTILFPRKSPDSLFSRKELNFFAKKQMISIFSRICSWLTHILARTYEEKYMSCHKNILRKIVPFVSHVAERFCLFLRNLRINQLFLIFAIKFSRKCKTFSFQSKLVKTAQDCCKMTLNPLAGLSINIKKIYERPIY